MGRLALGLVVLSSLCFYACARERGDCAPGEVKMPCGKYCEPSCKKKAPPCEINLRMCRDQCRCEEGLYRYEETGECVTFANCSKIFC